MPRGWLLAAAGQAALGRERVRSPRAHAVPTSRHVGGSSSLERDPCAPGLHVAAGTCRGWSARGRPRRARTTARTDSEQGPSLPGLVSRAEHFSVTLSSPLHVFSAPLISGVGVTTSSLCLSERLRRWCLSSPSRSFVQFGSVELGRVYIPVAFPEARRRACFLSYVRAPPGTWWLLASRCSDRGTN